MSRGASLLLNCLFDSSLQVVIILNFYTDVVTKILQFNKKARNMKLLCNHMYKTMKIIPFFLKGCALNMRL